MKLSIQIFTIYLFTLSLIPCGEGGGGIMAIFEFFAGEEISLVEQGNDPCEDAPCSPFCICSSCVPILDTPETGVVLPTKKQVVFCKTIPTCDFNYLPSPFYKDIWQPPKLG